MAQHDNDGQPTPAADSSAAGGSANEFEDAVTTEITAVMQRAFGDDFGSSNVSHVEVTDIDLSARPLPNEFEVFEPGTVLNGRFEIVELVHSGGMSHVYRAIDVRRHRKGAGPFYVAIKTMRRQVASQRESRLSLEREASRGQRLSHPNIVNIFDFDEHDGCFYLVMEWLEGESVNSLLKRTRGQRLDPSFAWPIIEGAASAVQHAHLNNIVHADINPSNIFITATHEIKLLDFGVARDCGDKSDVAESRMAWATQTYASPELLNGMTPVFEDDIFSLGCVAYRLLSGEHPFSGSTSIKAKEEALKVAPISGLADADWQNIRRCLDYNRTQRPKTAAVFCYDLHRRAGGQHNDAGAAPRWERWLLAGTVAALAAVAAWWAWSDRLQPPAPRAEPIVVEEITPESQPVPAEESPLTSLLAAADQAMVEQRYVQPVASNARDLYRQVLSIDPENPAAQRGLRLISDAYVRQAEAALRAGDTAASVLALEAATDADPANPALALVDYLLVAAGDQRLVEARTAAAAGDVAQTTLLLAAAEQFPHIDAASLEQVRAVLNNRLSEQELLQSIAAVDEHIMAGRLLAPAAENAQALMLELVAQYGDDTRLLAVNERLGQRLLTNAALATGAAEFDAADEYLDAVEVLSVASKEVATARLSLQRAREAAARAAAVTEVPNEAATTVPLQQSVPPALAGQQSNNQVTAGDDEVKVIDNGGAGAPPAAAVEPPQPRVRTLSELGIQRFVAPAFPRSARRRGISGFVEVGFTINPDGSTADLQILDAQPADVFNRSAAAAVRQWRFEPREPGVQARITLTFNLAP